MKKSLYLTYDGLSDPLGQSQIIPYLNGLVDKDTIITIISFEKRSSKKLLSNIQNELHADIRWHSLSYTKNPPVLSTLWDLYKLWKLAFKLNTMSSFDIVHCRSYVTALIGLKMKRQCGTRFLFDMRGFWIEERVEGRLWNLKNPIFKLIHAFFKRKEKDFFNESDHIISLTHAAKKEIINRHNLNKEKVTVIPCCVDTELFNPEHVSRKNISEIKEKLGINQEKILVYIGSLGTWYDLNTMLDYFATLHKSELWKFLFITKSETDILKKELERRKMSDLVIIISLERVDIPKYLMLADHGIFIYHQGYSRLACSPTKMGEMMAMGIPVVGNDIGDTSYILQKYNAGKLIESGEITKLKETSEILSISKSAIRNGACDYFSLEKGIEQYSKIYLTLSLLSE